MNAMETIADNLWIMRYPLQILGENHGRVVTVIRLNSGKLILHSTGPFTTDDIGALQRLGEPGWLVEATLLHDTYAKQAQALFPALPYLAPEGFNRVTGVLTKPLLPAPAEWKGEVEVLALAGLPKIKEHLFFHRPSKTLIVGDLLFHYANHGTGWAWFQRRYLMGLRRLPGVSRFFKMLTKDQKAFEKSLEPIWAWDFERIIVAHQRIVKRNAKERLRTALQEAGLMHQPATTTYGFADR
jgi:glyoxylase-like metal-dependent hydrolase (beta-lactamase superfamily II)